MDLLDQNSISNFTDSVTEMTKPLKAVLIIWFIFVIVLGIVGNVLVLIGSIKYKALEMDKISIFFLESIAVTDLTYAVIGFVPPLVTVIANRWVFGGTSCVFLSIVAYIIPGAEIGLITAVAAYRCFLVVKPFASVPELTCLRKVCVLALAALPVLVDRLIVFTSGNKAFLDLYFFTCAAGNIGKWHLVSLFLNILTPALIICSTNIFLIYKAAKLSARHKQRINAKGTLTVILLCGAFLISYLPYCVTKFVTYENDGKRGWMDLLAVRFFGINVIVNPMIYTMTNRRFCIFMKSMIGMKQTI